MSKSLANMNQPLFHLPEETPVSVSTHTTLQAECGDVGDTVTRAVILIHGITSRVSCP